MKLFALIVSFLLNTLLFAQNEVVLDLPYLDNNFKAVAEDGPDRWFLSFRQLTHVNVDNSTWEEIDIGNRVRDVYQVKLINNRFYMIGNRYKADGNTLENYFLCMSKTGTVLSDVGFQRFSFSSGLVELNNSVYFHGYDSLGLECVWTSSGDQASTMPILYAKSIKGIAGLANKLYVLSDENNGRILRFDAGTVSELTFPNTIKSPLKFLTQNNESLFFTATTDSLGNNYIFNFNAQNQDFIEIFYGNSWGLEFKLWGANQFVLTKILFSTTFASNDLWIGDINKNNARKAAVKNSKQDWNIYFHLSKQIFVSINDATGFELATIRNDSLVLRELQDGPGGAAFNNSRNNSSTPIVYFNFNDTVYAFLTNGNDANSYLYQLQNDSTFVSITKSEDPLKIISPFIYKNKLFWFEQYSDSQRNDRGRLYSKDLNNRNTQPALPQNNEWYRQLAIRDSRSRLSISSGYFVPIKTVITKNKEVVSLFFSTLSSPFSYYFDQKNFDSTTRGGSCILIKYDSLGNRLWTTNFGDQYSNLYYKSSNNFEVTSKGDIIAIGAVFAQSFWNKETEDFGGLIVKRFIIKIDGKTGEILWKKLFYPTRYLDPLEFDELTLDFDDNIYIAGIYEDFFLTIGGHSVTGMKSPLNVLLKFDANGDIVWIKNMETPWLDRRGRTHVFKFIEKTKQLIAIQSQDWYNVSSSCKWDSSNTFIQLFDLEGNIINTLSFFSDDLLSLTSGDFNNDGNFYGFGYARGNVRIGDYSFETARTNKCNLDEGFALKLNGSSNRVQFTETTFGKRCQPIETHVVGDFIYTLCGFFIENSSWRNYLAIIKQDLKGEYIGYKIIDNGYSNDYVMFNSFDITEDKIAVAGIFSTSNTSLGVANTIYSNSLPFVSLLYINNDNWSTDSTWFIPVQTDLSETKAEFKVYPNPFTDNVTVVLPGSSHSYTNYAIYDMKGAEINSGTLTSEQVQTLNLSYLTQGVFILRCFNGNKAIAAKLIKL